MTEDNKETTLATTSQDKNPKNAGRKSITKELHEARIKRACTLFYQGFSYDSILSKINIEGLAQQWGKIRMSQLRLDLGNKFNYSKDFSLREYQEQHEGEKQAFIARIEKDIESLRMAVMKCRVVRQGKKDNDGNFISPKSEELKSVFTLGQLLFAEREILEKEKLLAQLKGYTLTVNVNNKQVNNYNQTNLAIYERADEKRLDMSKQSRQGITNVLRALSGESTESTGHEVLDGVVDESE